MTHSICTTEPGEELAYFQRLWRTLLDPNVDPRISLERLLEHETVDFDLKYAFLSAIDLENETERFEIVHGTHEMLRPGTTVPLSKTYCRKTIADPEGTMAINDAPAEGWEEDPAYETYGFRSYLGTTVSVGGDLYRTLCFVDTTPRDEPIRDAEKALVEMYSQWVAHTIELWDGLSTPKTRGGAIEGRAVSSEAIDSMMDALRSRPRRVVLMTLIERPTEVSIAALERDLTRENARISLFHSHLPKLADTGYIEWDEDAETVSRGPRFSEVEPLVQLLREYNTTFSE